jgi:hypothetical protein
MKALAMAITASAVHGTMLEKALKGWNGVPIIGLWEGVDEILPEDFLGKK